MAKKEGLTSWYQWLKRSKKLFVNDLEKRELANAVIETGLCKAAKLCKAYDPRIKNKFGTREGWDFRYDFQEAIPGSILSHSQSLKEWVESIPKDGGEIFKFEQGVLKLFDRNILY